MTVNAGESRIFDWLNCTWCAVTCHAFWMAPSIQLTQRRRHLSAGASILLRMRPT